MKKAGELLSFFFDNPTVEQFQRYTALCEFWRDRMKMHKIAAAVDHTKIARFERHILLVEADHPGWIQILQSKQRELLHEFQRRFPEILMSGISFRLSRTVLTGVSCPPQPEEPPVPEQEDNAETENPSEEAFETTEAFEKMDPELQNTFRRLKRHLKRRSRERGESE
ncbi:MAG: DUF721 domain-containing protein [Spirochaetaceae bacterium]|jgi:hypothetical protein|nr:DUF721 domain-containing protein [Spirochaetaceae bacterium]